jgi:hypothetical protein
MSATCTRLKALLLGRWLAVVPTPPALHLSSDATSITAAFQYAPPTAYNTQDVFELQACPGAALLHWQKRARLTQQHSRALYSCTPLKPS